MSGQPPVPLTAPPSPIQQPLRVVVVATNIPRRRADWKRLPHRLFHYIAQWSQPRHDSKRRVGSLLSRYAVLATMLIIIAPLQSLAVGLGQGGCSIRDEAPVYKDSDGDKILANVRLHDCVPGITTHGVFGHEFVFERNDDRVHVALPAEKEGKGLFVTGWMNPADLSNFTFECGCGAGKKAEKQCTPFVGPETKDWNQCFSGARDKKQAELKMQPPIPSSTAQVKSESSKPGRSAAIQLQGIPKNCKPDISRLDKITKQQSDIWVQKMYSTSFGSSLFSTSEVAITVTVGRYGTFNAVNVEILKEEASAQNAAFESSLRGAKGNQFFLGFKDGEPVSFVATDVGNSTRVRDDIIANTGKIVTTVVLSASLSDEAMSSFREALTGKQVDAIRVLLAGGVTVEQAVKDGNGKKLAEKFLCFYQFLDRKGLSRTAVPDAEGQAGRPATASASEGRSPARDYAASAPGKYLRKGSTSDYVELNPDGTFLIQMGKKAFHGTYKVQADVITLKMSNGVANRSRFVGNSVTDADGTVWERDVEIQAGKLVLTPA